MVTPHFCLQILVETLFSSDAIYQRFTVEIKSRFDLVSLIRFFSSAKDTISKFPLQWFRRILVQSDYWLFRVVCLDREEQCHECCYLVSIITSVLTEQSALSGALSRYFWNFGWLPSLDYWHILLCCSHKMKIWIWALWYSTTVYFHWNNILSPIPWSNYSEQLYVLAKLAAAIMCHQRNDHICNHKRPPAQICHLFSIQGQPFKIHETIVCSWKFGFCFKACTALVPREKHFAIYTLVNIGGEGVQHFVLRMRSC